MLDRPLTEGGLERIMITYYDVVCKKLLAVCFRQRDRVLHLGAAGVRAEVSVPDGRQTDRVIV